MSKILAHIDLDAFFVTCEELRDPTLIGKPVIIGGRGRGGIVSTCSYAARKYGCHSGMPTFQALKLCPHAIVLPGDHHYYSVLSNSFMAFIRQFSKLVEQASVDECYVDFTAVLEGNKDPEAFFRDIQKQCLDQLGLKMSIGVAPTRWLAKMGSDLHKPMGLTFVRRKDIPTLIYPLPIEKFWGIGKKSAPRLKEAGINTIGDLARSLDENPERSKERFGKFYSTVNEWVHGRGSDEIDMSAWDPKSVSHSETLMHDSDTEAEIAPILKKLAERVSDSVRYDKKMGQTITLQVKDTNFKLHSKSVSVRDPIDDAGTLYEKCLAMYRENYIGMPVRLVGVGLSKLCNPAKQSVQMTFWNYESYEERDQTKLLINDLNRKMDKPLLTRASEAKKKGK